MNAVTAAAMERLQRVLDAPVTGPSRHAQVAEVAEQHAADEPRIGIVTKQVAVEPVAEDVTGELEAVVSDFLPDRQMETFVPGAFDNAVAKIRKSGKATPVLFGHSQDTIGAVLGMVPSTGWRVDHEGLHANGWLDVSEPLGQKMYRMLKSGALQWSIGFTISKTRPGRAGITELIEVDELLELSVVPVPANERTRTTTAKHLDPDRSRKPRRAPRPRTRARPRGPRRHSHPRTDGR
jgi:HK97 family phage prohead protease